MNEQGWGAPIIEVAGGASRALFVVLALLAGLLGAVALFGMTSDEFRAPALVIAGIPGGIFGAAAWWVRKGALERRLIVHPEGIREQRGSEVTALRFDEIETIAVRTWQLQAAHVHGAGILGVVANAAVAAANAPKGPALPYDATQVTVTIAGAGRTIVLRKWDKRWVEAYAAIRARVEPRLLERARMQLAQTGGVAFGPIALAAHAVSVNGGDALPVHQLEKVVLDPWAVSFRRIGKRRPVARVRLSKVPNVHVMLELVGERTAAMRLAA